MWGKLKNYDASFADVSNPTCMSRLLSSCNVGYMVFTANEKKMIHEESAQLQILLAEFLYLLEQFEDSIDKYRNIFENSKELEIKALAMAGMGSAYDMNFDKTNAKKCFEWVVLHKNELSKSLIYYNSLYRYANSIVGVYGGMSVAIQLYREYLDYFRTNSLDARYFRQAQFKLINALLCNNKIDEARKEYNVFDLGIQDSYVFELQRMFNVVNKYGYYEGGLK